MKVIGFRVGIPTGFLSQLVKPGEFEAVLYINHHRYGPGEEHDVHQHSDREEIFICLKGRGSLTGTHQRDISQGDVVVLRPGERHGFTSDDRDPLEYLCIGCALPSDQHPLNRM